MRKRTASSSEPRPPRGRQTDEQRELMSRLQRALQDSNISVRTAGAALGCNPSTVSRQIRGQVGLSAEAEVALRGYLARIATVESVRSEVQAGIAEMAAADLEITLQFMQHLKRWRKLNYEAASSVNPPAAGV